MVCDTEKFESILIECIESKNEHQFHYILDELRINPNKKLKCFDGLSTFEKVLQTPYSKRFVEICIYNGSDFYKKNADGIYPLHYAINSCCADNLEAILKPFDESFTPLCDDHLVTTQYSRIVNEKLDAGYNYLHLLISNITKENYEEISKMIKLMIVNGCNVNSPNDEYETPFYLLLKNSLVENDLVKFVCDNIRIDYYTYNSNKMNMLMKERGLQSLMSEETEFILDVDYMTHHIGEWNAVKFTNNLEHLKNNSKEFRSDLKQLLEEAILKNLPTTVDILMSHGVDTNEIPKNSKFKMTPAFLACTMGYHQVLKILLNDRNLSFQSNHSQGNLLHQIFASESVDEDDRKKSFDLIIADKRCTLNIINQTDDKYHVPIYYACQYACHEITKELLRRGAYVGYESVLSLIKKIYSKSS